MKAQEETEPPRREEVKTMTKGFFKEVSSSSRQIIPCY
jgi:hypothetical protein